MNSETIDSYNREADKLVHQYESITFEELNEQILDLLPTLPSRVLEIGAGSGRDAAWFAKKSHEVVAIEPAHELRKRAQLLHDSPSITWVDDSLPHLEFVKSLGPSFDLIWLSAVWMHLARRERSIAFANLVGLLSSPGRIMFTLRHGPAPKGRKFHPVSVDELLEFSGEHQMKPILIRDTGDSMHRKEITWQTVMLERDYG